MPRQRRWPQPEPRLGGVPCRARACTAAALFRRRSLGAGGAAAVQAVHKAVASLGVCVCTRSLLQRIKASRPLAAAAACAPAPRAACARHAAQRSATAGLARTTQIRWVLSFLRHRRHSRLCQRLLALRRRRTATAASPSARLRRQPQRNKPARQLAASRWAPPRQACFHRNGVIARCQRRRCSHARRHTETPGAAAPQRRVCAACASPGS
jgi:hypothetical protein